MGGREGGEKGVKRRAKGKGMYKGRSCSSHGDWIREGGGMLIVVDMEIREW